MITWTDLLKIATGMDVYAAASEAKKSALMKKYSLDRNNVELAAETDPTPNGLYTEWVCREIKKGHLNAWSHSDPKPDHVVTETLSLFTRLKQSPEYQAASKQDPNRYVMDVMQVSFNGLYELVRNAKQMISKNQQEIETINAYKFWTGEFEGHRIDMYLFATDDLGSGGAEAYSLVSSGPSLSHDLNPLPQTAWCTTQTDTAAEYLNRGDAYIIKVDGKNYCNIHEATRQCMDANNRPMGSANRLIRDPIVKFALENADLPLEYFILNEGQLCHQCKTDVEGLRNNLIDTRYGHEGKRLCMACFSEDWISEIKRYIMNLYNANPDAFPDDPTTLNMRKWIKLLWEEDGKEHERNFWNPEDVEPVLRQLGIMK